jgi:chromosome partitioning protein
MTARLLTILGPKGGVGKSTIASNMLIAARLHGIETAGLDLDSQRSFAGWAETRAAAGREPACMVAEGRVTDWAAGLPDAELVIIDTPPGLEGEEHVTALRELALRSDLVLVPALPEGPSLTRLVTVPAELGAIGGAIVFVLNRVVKGRVRLPQARAFLAEHGELCPVEIPSREQVHWATDAGSTVAEEPGSGGHEEMLALWGFVAGRV